MIYLYMALIAAAVEAVGAVMVALMLRRAVRRQFGSLLTKPSSFNVPPIATSNSLVQGEVTDAAV